DPSWLATVRNRQCHRLAEVTVPKGRRIDVPPARSDLRMQLRSPQLAVRHTVCDHHTVTIVSRTRRWRGQRRQILEKAVDRRGGWQYACEPSRALHPCFAPDDFLHRLLGFHPRSASLTDATRNVHRHLQPQSVALSRRVAERIPPLRSHEHNPFVHIWGHAHTDI